jgi:hypothetical protein
LLVNDVAQVFGWLNSGLAWLGPPFQSGGWSEKCCGAVSAVVLLERPLCAGASRDVDPNHRRRRRVRLVELADRIVMVEMVVLVGGVDQITAVGARSAGGRMRNG